MRTLKLSIGIAFVVALSSLFVAAPASAATTCKKFPGPELVAPPIYYNYCKAPAADFPNYKGWAGRTNDHCDFYPWNSGMACTAIAMMIPAYQWTSTGWKATNRGEGEQIYVYPFTAEWRWVYLKARYAGDTSGWHAIQAKHITLVWQTRA